MELKSLNCPNCGASVQIPEGVGRFFCTYCGTQIQIDDGKITFDLNANINLNHQYSDVARLKELELQEQERERQEEQQRNETKRKLYCAITLIASISIYILGFYYIINVKYTWLDMIKLGAFLSVIASSAGPIAAFIIAPPQWRSKTAINHQTNRLGCLTETFVIMIIITLWIIAVLVPIYTAWKQS